jgi:hypothetical protein
MVLKARGRDRRWQPHDLVTVEIEPFVVHSEQKGIFGFGQCDLHIEDRQETLEFRLCHESDVENITGCASYW